MKLVIPGAPVPLQRSRTSSGRHYLPKRSRAFRSLVRAEWMAAGRATVGDRPFTATMRFYGAHGAADVDNLAKAILDALNDLAFTDDRQAVHLDARKLPLDDEGPRAEIELAAA
jgi:crossover junction endodeoxyribonuclease RusA